MAEKTHYEILEITPEASDKEIQEAYRLLASMLHPDRFAQGSRQWVRANEKMQELNVSYEILRHEARRTAYNRSLKVDKTADETLIAPPPAATTHFGSERRSQPRSPSGQGSTAPQPPSPEQGSNWQHSPRAAPHPSARVRQRMVLTADGMGDAPDLETAIRQARDGDSILLRPGIFRIPRQIVVSRTIDLIGSGMAESTVTCSQGGSAMRFTGTNQWLVRGIAFRHVSTGHVVEVDNGIIEFEDCSFSKGEIADGTDSGLRFTDTAQGRVYECDCFSNGHGISVHGSAKPLLERNKCHSNSSCGIYYGDSAAGTARINYCDRNRAHGIFVSGEARPLLDGNYCSENAGCGIIYADQGGGEARDNECSKNRQAGIQVAATAKPYLGFNRCARPELRDLRNRSRI